MTLDDVGNGVETAQVLVAIIETLYDKLKKIHAAKGATDADLDAIIVDMDARLKARGV